MRAEVDPADRGGPAGQHDFHGGTAPDLALRPGLPDGILPGERAGRVPARHRANRAAKGGTPSHERGAGHVRALRLGPAPARAAGPAAAGARDAQVDHHPGGVAGGDPGGHRHEHHQRRAAGHPRQPGRDTFRSGLDFHGLRVRERGHHPALGVAGGPLRAEELFRVFAGGFHGVERAVRAGARTWVFSSPRACSRASRAAGCWRRRSRWCSSRSPRTSAARRRRFSGWASSPVPRWGRCWAGG